MKLAEALILRADLQRRIEQLKRRILDNVMVQAGDDPAEDPNGLLAELGKNVDELVELIQRINRTNSATPLNDEMSLADSLSLRDSLHYRQSLYRDIAKGAVIKYGRHTRSEVKFASTVNVAEIQALADEIAKQHRELDASIQALNWTTDLLA